MAATEVHAHCQVRLRAAARVLGLAVGQLHLLARACHRALTLARTVPDLAGAEVVEPVHLAETSQYLRADAS